MSTPLESAARTELSAGQMTDLAYDRLRTIAQNIFASKTPGAMLQPTALVHEAYLKIAEYDSELFEDYEHFVSVAVRAMRQVLVDYFRRRSSLRRGGDLQQITLKDIADYSDESTVDVIELDAALNELAALSDRQARVVELKFFGGFTTPEIARATGVSGATVERDWRAARAWLRVRLRDVAEGF